MTLIPTPLLTFVPLTVMTLPMTMTHMRRAERRRASLIGTKLNRVIYWAVITMDTSALKFLVLGYLPNMVKFLTFKILCSITLFFVNTGFKIILLATTFVTSIITIVTPFLAQAGYGWIFASRIVMGFCHGVTFPLLQGCWSVWAPPMETSNLIAIYTAGNSVGTCLIFPLGGLLAGSSLGWQSIFYFTGGSGILWCICWAFLVYDSPSQHPRISQEEKMYIESSIEVQQQHAKSSLGNEELDNKAVPWKAMLTSKVVWSVAIAHLASNWGVYQMNSLLPTYLNDVLQ